MANVVLVHGTTQSAAGFRRLITSLEHRGHRTVAVDVPSGAATTAEEYARLLAAQIPAGFDHPLIAAHSAAGLLMPALARELDANHQVWLAAAVADYVGRRSLLAEIKQSPLDVFNTEWVGIDPTSDPVLAAYFLFHDANLATLKEALLTIAPCDLSAVYAETPPEDPARISSTYVLPTGDRTLSTTWMRRVARQRLRCEPIEIAAAAHNFYAARSEDVAAIIDEVAKTL
ncbi:esterase/lipase family protein [Arthrobacter rhombi]|nr:MULTISPECIES: alpha/beta hydrolase [Micrococcaceae]PCC26128.1 alpha/beta hydrolase [Glutamicibacter sp. BW78]